MPNNPFDPRNILSAMPDQTPGNYNPYAITEKNGLGGFSNNPFYYRGKTSDTSNQGTPQFDPQTGMFIGLQNPQGQLGQPRTQVSTAERQASEQTRALIQSFPSLAALFNANIAPNELAQLKSSLQTSPQYAQLAQRIAQSNAFSEADTNNQLLQGAGGDTARTADKLARELDPEFYKTRGATAASIQGLLQPGLSGGETESIQRYLNQQNNRAGTLANPTQISTVSNAMTFGEEARKRQERAIGLSNNFLPASRTGVDSYLQATGKPGNITGFKQGAGDQLAGTANNASSLFGGLTQGQNANLSNERVANSGTNKFQTTADIMSLVNSGVAGGITGAKAGGY